MEQIKKIEEQRKKLVRYYYWQLFWGAIFVVIVMLGSIVLGARSDKFWLYIVIPLVVIGSFGIYIRSTFKQIEQKFNQLLAKDLINKNYPEFTFLGKFELDRNVFRKAGFVENFLTVKTRNLISGKINDKNFIVCHLQTYADKEETTSIVFSGLFGSIQCHECEGEIYILPNNEDTKATARKLNLEQTGVLPGNHLLYWSKDDDIHQKIKQAAEKLITGLNIKDGFYLSVKDNTLFFGIFDFKDLVETSLKKPLTAEIIEQQQERIKHIIEFVATVTAL